MTHRGRHLARGEQEAAIAADRDDRHVAARILGAERGGKAEAEIVLIAGRQVGARPVDRKGETGGKTDLRDLVDEDAVFRQFGADRREVGELRRELGQALVHARMAPAHLLGARRPPPVVRRQHVEQAAQDRLCRPDQRDRGFGEPRRLLRIGIDANDRKVAVDAPMQEWHVQVRAHGQHHVRLGPQVAADRQVDRERIAIVEHAAAAAIGEDRRLQEMR